MSAVINRILSQTRNSLKDHPGLYRSYLALRGHDVDFPGPSTRLHITGYPRCANTSTYFIFREFIPEERLTSHIHSVADLKVARRHGVDALVMVRAPYDAISSHVVKRRNQPGNQHRLISALDRVNRRVHLDLAARYYVNYYGWVLDHADDLILGSFEQAIHHPAEFVEAVTSALSFDVDWSPEDVERGRRSYRQRKKELEEQGEKAAIRGLPDEQKERQKDKVKERLRDHPMIGRAETIFAQLQDHLVGSA